MKIQTFNSLGLDVPLNVPASIEEFDQNAGRAGACLDEAINNIAYRGCLAEFRPLFLHGVEANADKNLPAILGVEDLVAADNADLKRRTKTVEKKSKGDDGQPETVEAWDETEAKYFSRVNGALGLVTPDAIKGRWQGLANDVAARIAFDASATERKPATPKTPPKKYLEFADKKIAEGQGEKLAKRLSKILGREVAVEREALARAIQEDMAAEAAKREAALLNS